MTQQAAVCSGYVPNVFGWFFFSLMVPMYNYMFSHRVPLSLRPENITSLFQEGEEHSHFVGALLRQKLRVV